MKGHDAAAPHDAFFKDLLEDVGKASAFIAAFFPEDLLESMHLESLRIVKNSFTGHGTGNPVGTEFSADLIFECDYGEEGQGKVTLLFEHKSYRDDNLYFQMLKYMLGIWLSKLKQRTGPEVVLPVVFYHGGQDWKSGDILKQFKALPEYPKLLRFVPQFDLVFINLREIGDEKISSKIDDPGLRISLLLMRHVRSKSFLEKVKEIFSGVENMLRTKKGRRELDKIWLYLGKVAKVPIHKIIEAMENSRIFKVPTPKGSTLWQMEQEAEARGWAKGTAAGIQKGIEKGREQGIEKGIEKGKKEGKIEAALALLDSGFTLDQVSGYLKLGQEEVEELWRRAAETKD